MVDLKASSSAMIATTLMEMAAAAPAYLRLEVQKVGQGLQGGTAKES